MKQLEYSHWLISFTSHISDAIEKLRSLTDRVRLISTSCQLPEFFDIDSAADRALLRAFFDECGVRGNWLHAIFGHGMNLVTIEDDASFERHRTVIEFAGEAAFEAVVVHGGVASNEPTFLKRAKASLLRLLPWAEKADVKLALECPTGPPAMLDSLLEWKESLANPHLALCLDTGHANCWQPDFADCVRQTLPHCCCLHLHDNDGVDDLHQPPGEGTIPWDAFVDLLIETGYDGVIGSECDTPEGWSYEDLYERFRSVFGRVLAPGNKSRAQ